MRNNIPLINVYKKKLKSEISTQLLYGETFKEIKRSGSWIKIKNDVDNYKGFIKEKKFPPNHKDTHKVCKLYAKLYSKPYLSNTNGKKLSFGSKIKVTQIKNNFCKFDNFWIKKIDLKEINYKTKNIFKLIKIFTNTKYKWGGKNFDGIDCSGLVQIFLNYNNKYCPRDANYQIKYFKKKIKLKNIKKNDLIFWKGHVAVALSRRKLIHAYGPSKKTIIMPIRKTIDRIRKIARLKVVGIRRII